MGPDADYIELIRRIVVPPIGWITALAEDSIDSDLTTTRAQGPDQYVATVEMDEEQFEEVLAAYGFTRNPLAWMKHHRSGEVEEGSWRLPFGNNQIHVILFDGSMRHGAATGQTLVYAHTEYRWDRYPIKHLRGDDITYDDAKYALYTMLDHSGTRYTVESDRR